MAFKTLWNEENIRAGLERFKMEHGRYPHAREFDAVDYLPTARQIQRKYGGLPALRTTLKLEGVVNFTKGQTRSATAKESFLRSYAYEELFYDFLISIIPEEFVHEQKRIRPSNVNCDFFIYNKANRASSIVIDVFYAETLFNLGGIVNIKKKRYAGIQYKTYFVSIGEKFSQEEIEQLMRNKKIATPANIHVCSEGWFKDNLRTLLNRTST